jgi:hypothetical protein
MTSNTWFGGHCSPVFVDALQRPVEQIELPLRCADFRENSLVLLSKTAVNQLTFSVLNNLFNTVLNASSEVKDKKAVFTISFS